MSEQEPTRAFQFRNNFRDYKGLDRTRERQSVHVGPPDAERYDRRLIHLGDVWKVKSTGRWYFTWGGGGIRKGGHKDGYGAPSEAAEAMLEEILSYYQNRAQGNLNQLNSYRVAAALPALRVTEEQA